MPKKKFTEVDFDMFVMPFGIHKNKTLREIPAGYLIFIAEQDYAPEVLKAYVDENLDWLSEDAADEEQAFKDEENFGKWK